MPSGLPLWKSHSLFVSFFMCFFIFPPSGKSSWRAYASVLFFFLCLSHLYIFRRVESRQSARLFFLSFLNVFLSVSFSAWRKVFRAWPSLSLFHFSFKFLFYLSLFSAARKVCMPVLLFMLLTLLVFFVSFLSCFLRLSILNAQDYLNSINTPFFIIFSFSFPFFCYNRL